MIELHSDDYGLFPAQSKRIAECVQKKAINGISIVPNSPYLDECMSFIAGQECEYTIHINLVLGKRLSPISGAEHISKGGVLCCSFSKLLLASYLPSIRKRYYEEIKGEIRAQINATKGYYKNRPLRLNSHRHYHMIPIVFDAMAEIIREDDLEVSHIRFPIEPVSRYIRLTGKTGMIRPINIVKAIILNTLSARNRSKHPALFNSLSHMEFAGVIYSGNMTINNTLPILEDAIKRGVDMEMAFHPGGVFEPDDLKELNDEEEASFQSSHKRTLETESVIALSSSLASLARN